VKNPVFLIDDAHVAMHETAIRMGVSKLHLPVKLLRIPQIVGIEICSKCSI
jgi:hypothetical protein